MKPLILITSAFAPKRAGREELPEGAFDYLKSVYSQRILEAGGVPIIAPNADLDSDGLMRLLSFVDGVILSGGSDIDPKFYGQAELHPKTKISWERDSFEWQFVKVLVDTKIPVLAICRGHQLLNVAFGGTLFQDIEVFRQRGQSYAVEIEHRFVEKDSWRMRSWHWVNVEPDSVLFRITRRRRLYVNSSHHQFVDKIGDRLVPIAFADDGAIESLGFMDDDRFLLSVQWHPEDMVVEWNAMDEKPVDADVEWVHNLFRVFVENCHH